MIAPFYRRSRRLVGYWRGDHFVVSAFRRGTVVPAPADVIALLSTLAEWTSVEAFARASGIAPRDARRTLDTLHRIGLVERRGRPVPDLPTAWDVWQEAAAFLHFSTRDHRFRSSRGTRRRIEQYAVETAPPSPTKTYPSLPRLPLPKTRRDTAFESVVRQRRTWRQFGTARPPLADLAAILRLTFGVQRWVDLGTAGRVMLRTSPSGGARHPTEAYILVRRIVGVAPGFYYYAPADHALVCVKKRRLTDREVTDLLVGQHWYAGAAAIVFLTSVFERTAWKYRTARSYKSLLLEAGHFAQTLCLAATARGLAPFCTAAFAAARVERHLGLKAERESVMYVTGFGARPVGVSWAPWPDESSE